MGRLSSTRRAPASWNAATSAVSLSRWGGRRLSHFLSVAALNADPAMCAIRVSLDMFVSLRLLAEVDLFVCSIRHDLSKTQEGSPRPS